MSKKSRNDGDVLHVVFGHSAGGTLRQARRKDQVISFWDDLSFGPINPPDAVDPAVWAERELQVPVGELGFSLETNLRLNAERKLLDEVTKFWDAMLSTRTRRVIWLCRRAAHEYAGFLECIWRLADEPFDVIDFTGESITRSGGKHEPVMSMGELHPNEITERALWDRAAPLTPAARDRYREMWRVLRAENAPFRVVDGDDLVSAPIAFYDEWLVSCTVSQWRKAARVIAETMKTTMTHGHTVGDLVLSGRLRALAAIGRLESQGDLSKPRFSEVRLPDAH